MLVEIGDKMRILHVVTLVTHDGSLGGPLRVAVNLMKSQREQGHEVLLAAGAQGYAGELPDSYDGVPVQLFPAFSLVPGTGFAGLTSPQLLDWLRKVAPTADIVHVHMARDLVTLPAALIAQGSGAKTIVHTHGMIDASDRLLAKPLDALMTRKALRKAEYILALTELEKQDLLQVDSSLDPGKIQILRNGVPLSDLRADVTADECEVLFLARLQERKRPLEFVRVAQKLAQKYPNSRFTLVGPDEGQGNAVLGKLAADNADGRIRWVGSLPADQTVARMAEAQVYVLPSENEPYGMTVVEAMTVGLPVVVMQDCGLAPEILETGSGLVADYSSTGLEETIEELIKSSALRQELGTNGINFVENLCSMEKVAEQLEKIYQAVSQ